MELFSYLLGKQAGGGITPTGTIDITQNGETDVTNYATANVNVSGGGGLPTADFKDVNFYDYDGTIRYSYSKNDFLALESLPENPTHNGLIADGWNWELADAKDYVTKYGTLEIGQNYSTADGSTRIYINLKEHLSPKTSVVTTGDTSATTTIDWGDGSATETYTGNFSDFKSHTYLAKGKYVISIKYSGTGKIRINSSGSNGTYALTAGSDYNTNAKYINCIEKIELGTNWTLYENMLGKSLIKTITIPKEVKFDTSYLDATFSMAYLLKAIIIPNVSNYRKKLKLNENYNLVCFSMGKSFINENDSYPSNNLYGIKRINLSPETTKSTIYRGQLGIQEVVLPDSFTTIENYPFNFCIGLQKIKASGLTTFSTVLGNGLYSLKILDLSGQATIPSLSSNGLGSNFPADCKIIVPDSLYNNWIAANNWSTYASQIVKASEV